MEKHEGLEEAWDTVKESIHIFSQEKQERE